MSKLLDLQSRGRGHTTLLMRHTASVTRKDAITLIAFLLAQEISS